MASSTEDTALLAGIGTFICFILSENKSLFSDISKDDTGVPKTSTPYFFNTPVLFSSITQLSAVCPPKLEIIPIGFSCLIIFSTQKGVTGYKYTFLSLSVLV